MPTATTTSATINATTSGNGTRKVFFELPASARLRAGAVRWPAGRDKATIMVSSPPPKSPLRDVAAGIAAAAAANVVELLPLLPGNPVLMVVITVLLLLLFKGFRKGGRRRRRRGPGQPVNMSHMGMGINTGTVVAAVAVPTNTPATATAGPRKAYAPRDASRVALIVTGRGKHPARRGRSHPAPKILVVVVVRVNGTSTAGNIAAIKR